MVYKPITQRILLAGSILILFLISGCSTEPGDPVSPTITPDIPLIASALMPVISGQGVPEAAAYDPKSPGPHTVVILDVSGTANNELNDLLPQEWLPASIRVTELVVIVSSERAVLLGTQAYQGGPPISAYRYEVDLELKEALTGRTLERVTFKGANPPPFPATAPVEQVSLYGSHFVKEVVNTWLCPSVIQQGCWIPVRTLPGQVDEDVVLSLTFSPDGQTLAAGTIHGGVMVWQVSDGTLLKSWLDQQDNPIFSMAFSSDGQSLARGSNNIVRLNNVFDNFKENYVWEDYDLGGVPSLVFSPDGKTLAAGSASVVPIVDVWQLPEGILQYNLKGHMNSIYSVAFSPDGQTLASGSLDNTVRLWKISDGSLLTSLDCTASVASIAFSPDGQILAASTANSNVLLWSVSGDGQLRTLQAGAGGAAYNLAFSADGQTLSSMSYDQVVRIWKVSDGSLLYTLSFINYPVRVAFSSDGKTLAVSAEDGSIQLWQRQDLLP